MSILVLLLFAGSGTAALVYEIVWQQLLQLVIGSSTVSVGVLLGMFMGGMCLGSLLAPRLIDGRRHPLRVYAGLELAIGAAGLALLAAMPALTAFYARWGGNGAGGLLLRAVVAAVCLLPPTFAMGATLPAISRAVESSRRGMSMLGFFYAANIAGAVFGCLLAGFYLLRVYDMAVATYVAVAINIAVAAVAWLTASRFQLTPDPAATPAAATPVFSAGSARTAIPVPRALVLIAIGGSGFCALAAEVIWTRLLSLLFSATVYTFSIILAVFLVGLGLGSSAGAFVARRTSSPPHALAWCQICAACGLTWSAVMLGASLPYWPINATLASNIWFNFQLDSVRAVWAILPAPIFWGASFPLALAACARERSDTGTLVGAVYAANTIGAIAGALGASFVLVPHLGSQHGQQVLIGVSLMAALLPLGRRPTAAAALLAGGAALLFAVPPLPGVLVAYGRHAASWAGHTGELLFVGEGLHASLAVSRVDQGVLNYHNAGKVQASSQPADMRLQRMLGHLTTLVPEHPRSVLVIGCGAGVTAGAVSVNPQVEKVTIVEIEPLVPKVAKQYFGPVNHDVLANPKVHVVVDDARHFLMTTTETFDAITSDPLDPWVKGAATLYTREFFDVARAHLNRGGVMTLFVQLYESSREAVQSEIATFFTTFPDAMIFGNTFEGRAIDTVLVGPAAPVEIWLDYVDELLRLPAYTKVARSLNQVNVFSATDLFGAYAGRARDLKGWAAGAIVNRDRNLKLQYLAGAGLNLHEGDAIYREILDYRVFPDDLFVASDSTLARLKEAMAGVRE